MPRGFSVVAIIAAYNEADVIDAAVRDLIDQDISVYLLDDGSTDKTVQAVEPYVGRGVIGIERLRPPEADPGEFNLKRIVRRKAQLAATLDADWFINHDADEFRESPWGDVPLKEAIRRVDALSYNAIDFACFDFRLIDDGGWTGGDVRSAFSFYSEAATYDRVQIRCWKKTACVELESTGGHDTRFEGRKVFPLRFVLRHYPIRSQAHGERKVFLERQLRFAEEERALGWHVQYEHVAAGTSFIHDPNTLKRFDPVDVRIGLALRHRGVEELEQSLEARKNEIDQLQHDLNVAQSDLAQARSQIRALDTARAETGMQLASCINELARGRDEITGLQNALEHRTIEVDNLQSAVADFGKQLDAFRRSFSWRWTAPARAIYRLLTGR